MNSTLSIADRAAGLERLRREQFDLAIVGGGITGAGAALDGAARGLSVALIEKSDFASGTSSRSTKLIHGGLRYLEQFEFGLVREALAERATLTRLAPHLSQPLAFVIPVYGRGRRSPLGRNTLKLGLGLWLYDLLAGRKNIARHRWIGPAEVLRLAPMLEPGGLKGGFVYYDCLTNDSRLVIEVVKAAAARGAVVANYAAARGFIKAAGRISGIEVEDGLSGRQIELRAKVILNATGVWSDELSQLDLPFAPRRLRPSKGMHVVVPSGRLPARAAVLIPSRGEGRFLFVVPWYGRTVIGTTDTDYTGDLDAPAAEGAEIDRVIGSASDYFPGAGLSGADVISTFAGLRPLAAAANGSTKDVSRKEEIIESPSGLISIIGGKLTTYRQMAESLVDLAVERLERMEGPRGLPRSPTRDIPLAGGSLSGLERESEARRCATDYHLGVETVEHLMETYGGNYGAVLEITRESEEMKAPLVAGLSHIAAEVVYAVRFEMVATVEDFLERRTRISLLASDRGESCLERVAELVAREQASRGILDLRMGI